MTLNFKTPVQTVVKIRSLLRNADSTLVPEFSDPSRDGHATCIHAHICCLFIAYIYIYIDKCTYIYICINICTHTYIRTYIDTYTRTYTCTYIHTYRSPWTPHPPLRHHPLFAQRTDQKRVVKTATGATRRGVVINIGVAIITYTILGGSLFELQYNGPQTPF